MEEKNFYGINWIGLFIKVIVFVIVVLLAIWLISKIVLKNKGLPFEENKKLFLDATVEYFKENLPEEGTKKSVTLKKLITKEYIDTLKDEKGNECNTKKSTSQIELENDHYNIKSEIVCGNKSEITYIKLGNENCEDCYIKVKDLEIKKKKEEEKEPEKTEQNNNTIPNNNVNSNVNNNTNTETTKQTEVILYEYIKETTEYSDWYVGNVTGNNIENSTQKISYSKYCKEDKCVNDKTENKNNYESYKIVDTWKQKVEVYRYKITVLEYKYSNADSLEGYTKTGKTKVAS